MGSPELKYGPQFVENASLQCRIQILEAQLAEKEASSFVDAVVLRGVTSAVDTQRARIERLEAQLIKKDVAIAALDAVVLAGVTSEVDRQRARIEFHEAAYRPPPTVPLSDITRAALDVVCKRDDCFRIDQQRTKIYVQQNRHAGLERLIARLRRGQGLVMKDVWAGLAEAYPDVTLCDYMRSDEESLRSHLHVYVTYDPSETEEDEEEAADSYELDEDE